MNKTDDAVNHPPHYSAGTIEVIEAIESWQLEYHLGNAVKYIARAGRKDRTKLVEDLEKAIWYIRRRIELEKEAPCRPNEMVETMKHPQQKVYLGDGVYAEIARDMIRVSVSNGVVDTDEVFFERETLRDFVRFIQRSFWADLILCAERDHDDNP